MTLETPTTKEIDSNIISRLQAEINQDIPLLQKSFLRVFSKVMSGVFILLWKYNGFIFNQLFVQTASDKDTNINGVILNPLTLWGRLTGTGEKALATHSQLLIDITVITQTGLIASGSQLLNSDTGVTYITLGSVLLDASIVSVEVKAVSDQAGGGGAGAIGNLPNGSILRFANPLANIDRNAIVTDETVTGSDSEESINYRQRIEDRFQKRPQGGALTDYVFWGVTPPGIVNIYPYKSNCPGQVEVYVESTPESSGDPDGIPTNAQLEEVLDAIFLDENGLASNRPTNDLVNAFPIDRIDFDVLVTGLQVENEAEIQQSIQVAVEEYFKGREPFIKGLDVFVRNDRITESAIGGIVNDIVSADGGIFINAVLFRDGVGLPAFSLGKGEKAKVNTVEFS